MNWRECHDQAEREQLLRLTREPMGGKIKLIWGLKTLCCPPDCDHLQAYAIVTGSVINGCAMAWEWPGGHRYLNGLRFGHHMAARPRPRFWKAAFESLLAGVKYGWTSIGSENLRARRILESDAVWLPRYTPRQAITSWFVPLLPSQAQSKASPERDQQFGVTPLDWRHVAVASGSGLAYWLGRGLHRIGRPGIAKPNREMRIGDYRPLPEVSSREIRLHLDTTTGYDGLVVVLPDDSDAARAWQDAAPRLSWKWHSTLYSLSWRKDAPLPTIPQWKGFWL